MIDLKSLVKSTSAYKIIKNDLQQGKLSHAYLVLCQDGENLKKYLTEITKLLFCKEQDPCDSCRACNLIEQNMHPDAQFFPKQGENVLVEEVNAIIQDTFVKPFESDKKVFVLQNGQTMNLSSQNKLLKTLEEPPKNVHIIIGATSEYALLPTIKSRVKKLQIPVFSHEQLFDALKGECLDVQRLKQAIVCGDGTVGNTLALYQDENLKETTDFCKDVLFKMSSSKEVLEYSERLNALKTPFETFLSVLELYLRDMLVGINGRKDLVFNKEQIDWESAYVYKKGAISDILQDVIGARKRIEANSSKSMVGEWILFKILEEKFKWQKL